MMRLDMRRRGFLKTLATVPAVPAALAQQSSTAPTPDENPKVDLSVADAAAEPVLRFFTAQQFAALRRLSEILMPASNGMPGALDAHAPEFLDFLIGESPIERQQLYRTGLDALNAQARKRFSRWFAEVETTQADQLLAPLREAWTYDLPSDPVARLLWTAKQELREATVNSREWSVASAATGQRAGGSGLYWLPID
jgi:hypothetical protein